MRRALTIAVLMAACTDDPVVLSEGAFNNLAFPPQDAIADAADAADVPDTPDDIPDSPEPDTADAPDVPPDPDLPDSGGTCAPISGCSQECHGYLFEDFNQEHPWTIITPNGPVVVIDKLVIGESGKAANAVYPTAGLTGYFDLRVTFSAEMQKGSRFFGGVGASTPAGVPHGAFFELAHNADGYTIRAEYEGPDRGPDEPKPISVGPFDSYTVRLVHDCNTLTAHFEGLEATSTACVGSLPPSSHIVLGVHGGDAIVTVKEVELKTCPSDNVAAACGPNTGDPCPPSQDLCLSQVCNPLIGCEKESLPDGSICSDEDGDVCMSHLCADGVCVAKPAVASFEQLADSPFEALQPHGVAAIDKAVWVMAALDLKRYSGKGVFQKTSPHSSKGDDLAVAPDGSMWLATVEMLIHLDRYGEPLKTYGLSATNVATQSNEEVWVGDTASGGVFRINLAGDIVFQLGESGSFLDPRGIALDDTHLYLAEAGTGTLHKYTQVGDELWIVGSEGSGAGQLSKPRDVALGHDGNLYVADSGNSRIEVFGTDGGHLASWSGQLKEPWGLSFAPGGPLYITDVAANLVHKVAATTACDVAGACLEGICAGGACVGVPTDCDDDDACTVDTCEEIGCSHAPLPFAPIIPQSEVWLPLEQLDKAGTTPNAGSAGGDAALQGLDISDEVSGKLGAGIDLADGGGIEVLSPAIGTGSFTASAWIRTTSVAPLPGMAILHQPATDNLPGWRCLLLNPGVVIFTGAAGTGGQLTQPETVLVNDGQWHHVACVRDVEAGVARVIVDGKVASQVQIKDPINHGGGQPVWAGKCATCDLPSTFDGSIDEVRVTAHAVEYAGAGAEAATEEAAIAYACHDGSICTAPRCHPAAGCRQPEVTCDDGSICTQDACLGGSCVTKPLLCGDPADTCVSAGCSELAGCVTAPAPCAGWTFEKTLTELNMPANNQLGSSIAVDGPIAAVAAAQNQTVFMYDRVTSDGAPHWLPFGNLVVGLPAAGFAGEVALSNKTVAVTYPASASARIFEYDANWGHKATMGVPDEAAGYGCDVAIDGDVVVVGANEHSGIGAAYIYERNKDGDNGWGELQVLAPPGDESGGKFGDQVAIDGYRIVVSATGSNDVHVFELTAGTGVWEPSAVVSTATAKFGAAVALQGDTLIVGSPLEAQDETGTSSGAAYVYERNAGGIDAWGQVAELKPKAVGYLELGRSIALHGDIALVGAPKQGTGAVYIFRRKWASVPSSWVPVQTLLGLDALDADTFGATVALGQHGALVGDPLMDGPDPGKQTALGGVHTYSLVDCICEDN